ncbi:MAG: hypothetical protein HQL03_10105 [Nitrospirae bacterium]|nr:hypothetical protein [Nitrospirota bacterium]MBF0592323.1 hypothetical protein [Nitrospirota bacterium]
MSKFIALVATVVFTLALTVTAFASVPTAQKSIVTVKPVHATEMMAKKKKKHKKAKKTAASTVSHVEING